MKPRKPKYCVDRVAEDLERSKQQIEDITSFYWSELRKALSNIEEPFISINSLGTFKVRYNKIEKLKKKYQYYLENDIDPEKMTFNKHSIKKLSESKIQSLNKIQDLMQKEKERRDNFKKRNHDSSKDLEK